MNTDGKVRMLKPSVEDMFMGRKSKYALAMGVAKRAREITVEQQEEVYESVKGKKPIKLAEKEFRDGLCSILQPDIDN